VVTSRVSKGFPIADAGFGAFAYALDILAGVIGDLDRQAEVREQIIQFRIAQAIAAGAVVVSIIALLKAA
jgi:hypothetical protein